MTTSRMRLPGPAGALLSAVAILALALILITDGTVRAQATPVAALADAPTETVHTTEALESKSDAPDIKTGNQAPATRAAPGPSDAYAPIAMAEATRGLVENPGLVLEKSLVLEYGRTYRLPLQVSGRHSPHKVAVQAFAMYRDVAQQDPAIIRLVFERLFPPIRENNDFAVEIDTRRLPRPRLRVDGRPSEAAIAGLYFDLQVSFFYPEEFDRLRVLLIETPQAADVPPVASGPEHLPLERVTFEGVGAIPADSNPGLANIKLGRYLPGSGVIPDIDLPEDQRGGAKLRNYLVTPAALSGVDPFWQPYPQGNPGADIDAGAGDHFAEASYYTNYNSRIWIQPIGPHRLDVQTDARAVLGSTLVEASLPDLGGSLRLEPQAADEPFDVNAPLEIAVDLSGLRAPAPPGLYPAHFVDYRYTGQSGTLPDDRLPIRLHLARMRRGGIPSLADTGGPPVLDGAPQPPDFAQPGATGTFSVNPFFLRPGRYSASLVVGDYLLNRADFDVGGRTSGARWGGDYAPPPPPVAFGDVSLAVQPAGTSVLGAPVTVRMVAPEGLDLPVERLFVQLYLAPHYSWGCARRVGRYVGPAVRLDGDGTAVLPAPPAPGRYEIHLFRPYEWSEAAKAALEATGRSGETASELELWKWQGGAAPFVEPLTRAVLDVDAPAAPEAIQLASGEVFEVNTTVPVTVTPPRPAGPRHRYELELWLAARRLPGGTFRRAARLRSETAFRFGQRPVRDNLKPLIVEGDALTTELMIAIEESFELRLWDVTAGYYVDRAAFRVFDPDGPPMPQTAPVTAHMTDWPTRNDPLRGLEAWLKPPVWCADPVFPEPPVLRLVQHVGGETGTAGDDTFVPVDAVFPGHPFFVEAEFETAPPDDLYRVDVGPSDAFLVERTENPRLYRSGVVNIVPEGR